ncbi:MAG: hypothetical protein LBU60_01935 [Clostridiales bacterium]|jgi:hypothetical protein|nr:hypothetical protein [Clostridiales bacterium]
MKNLPDYNSPRITTFYTPNSSIIGVHNKRIDYLASFTFITANNELMNMKFPSHAGGLQRPLARQEADKMEKYWTKRSEGAGE